MLYLLLQFELFKNQAVPDTGAIQSVVSEKELCHILVANPMVLVQELRAPSLRVQVKT